MITDSLDMMQRLDAAAMAAQNREPDPNIKHFDHQLWLLIYKVGKARANVVTSTFGLSNDIVNTISASPEEHIQRLASGTLLSFATLASTEQIINALTTNIDPGVFFENAGHHEADLAYWNLMARYGYRDPLTATTTFGVSLPVIEAVASSTDAHLRYLAMTVQEGFKLRFDEALIPEILNNNELTMAYVTRYVQAAKGA